MEDMFISTGCLNLRNDLARYNRLCEHRLGLTKRGNFEKHLASLWSRLHQTGIRCSSKRKKNKYYKETAYIRCRVIAHKTKKNTKIALNYGAFVYIMATMRIARVIFLMKNRNERATFSCNLHPQQQLSENLCLQDLPY